MDTDNHLIHSSGYLLSPLVASSLPPHHLRHPEPMAIHEINIAEKHLVMMEQDNLVWGWHVIFFRNASEILMAKQHILHGSLLVASGSVLLLFGLIYAVTRRFLLQPIAQLSVAATQIAKDKTPLSIPLHSQDELDDLARNMEAMAQAINVTQRDLEQRVQQRTQELEEKSRQLSLENQQRQATQIALEAMSERLTHSNHELQDFAYVISHDLQEPLRMVSSYLQLLKKRYHEQLNDDANEFIAFAIDGSQRMSTMIQGLLQYSRIETQGGAFASTDLNAVIADVLANLQLRIDELQAHIQVDELPTVLADRSQMMSLLQNLLSNGLKFHRSLPPEIHVGVQREAKQWLLWVKDNGIGIKAEDAERVFVMFQRLHTREEFPGMGIGLAVCKRIVERHGGTIRLESQPDVGTTFYFSLPFGDEVT